MTIILCSLTLFSLHRSHCDVNVLAEFHLESCNLLLQNKRLLSASFLAVLNFFSAKQNSLLYFRQRISLQTCPLLTLNVGKRLVPKAMTYVTADYVDGALEEMGSSEIIKYHLLLSYKYIS